MSFIPRVSLEINTKITLSWAHKRFAAPVHTLVSISIVAKFQSCDLNKMIRLLSNGGGVGMKKIVHMHLDAEKGGSKHRDAHLPPMTLKNAKTFQRLTENWATIQQHYGKMMCKISNTYLRLYTTRCHIMGNLGVFSFLPGGESPRFRWVFFLQWAALRGQVLLMR